MDKKKIIIGIVVVFLVWWLFTNPNSLTGTISSVAGGIWEVTTNIFSGVANVISGASK
ncbi:MAG: hypothetical protein J2O46_08215 [Nocardioides sp.]|nr:hypothetical protein [Nocardioides sp.]